MKPFLRSIRRPLVIGLLIAATGFFEAKALDRVDQDLRIMYAEYTVAATDLGHVFGDLIRYRSTIIRSIEAETIQDFERISSSLPGKQARIERAILRYEAATEKAARGKTVDSHVAAQLHEVKEKLEDYIAASHHTISLMQNRWLVNTPAQAATFREQAEVYAAKQAGPKLIAVTLALDRLLETVGEVAGHVREEADVLLRAATVLVILISLLLGALVLFGQGAPPAV